MDTQRVNVAAAGRRFDIEYRWVGAPESPGPVIVFLHEGLGSTSAWRDFPANLCEAVGRRGLVYSRPGYGGSTPRARDEHWDVDYMHVQAIGVLPALLGALGVQAPYLLLGHSDGGSIALIHAAHYPERTAALVVLAPHIFVEQFGLASIRQAREAYLGATDLRARLARHHADVDSAFWGWNDIWLAPAFVHWNIEALLPRIRGPVLALQGLEDPYGTLAQIEGIAQVVPGTRLLTIAECGHSAHRDHPEHVIEATRDFIDSITTGNQETTT